MRLGLGLGLGGGSGVAPFNTLSTVFNGVDDYGNMDAVLTAIASDTKATWTCRVKMVDATPSGAEVFLSVGDTSGTNSYFILYAHTNGELRCSFADTGATRWQKNTNAAAFTNDTWVHIGVTVNSTTSTKTLYVAGVAVAQSYILNNGNEWVGDVPELDNGRIACYNANGGGNALFTNSNIDEVRIWNTDLSAAQFTTHYNGGKPLAPSAEPLQGNLITPYRMGDNDTFPTLTDNKNSNDGTLVNMTSAAFVNDV